MTPQPKTILKAVPLFAALTDGELESLAARTSVRRFDAGAILFAEGEDCQGLYILITGQVRIFKSSANGREQVLAVEGPMSSIAELPVFDGERFPASASAMGQVEALFLSRADLRALCLEHPEVSLKMLQVVGARLRRLVGIIEELSFTTVRHRLISWLLREAKANGEPAGSTLRITLGLGHQELAAHIGTVRELVSRNLTRLQAQGLIEVNGKEIIIRDPEGMEAELIPAD